MDDRGIKSDGFGARGSTCGTIERSLSGSRQGARALQPLAIRQACLVPLVLKESGSGLLTVSDPGWILPESACRWPQVFHTKGIRLCPMTLFNPVFNCLTPIVIKRSKTQARGGTDSSRRSWLCRSASAPSQQACEPVQDRCSGPCSRPRHAAAWRSRKRAPAGWVAVEATCRPRQFGYETPQFRLERRLHAGSPYRSSDLVSAGPEPPRHGSKRPPFG